MIVRYEQINQEIIDYINSDTITTAQLDALRIGGYINSNNFITA